MSCARLLPVSAIVACLAILEGAGWPAGAEALPAVPPVGTSRPSPRSVKTAYSQESLNRLVLVSILYHCHEGDYRQHKPWVCAVAPEALGKDASLDAGLKSIGFQRVDLAWFHSPARKLLARFEYIEVRSLHRLSARRALVNTYCARNMHETPEANGVPILTESGGSLYLNYVHHRWVVDTKRSKIVFADD